MNDKEWLDKVSHASTVYNESRIHRDFQEEEVLKFVEWLHKQYGYTYIKPVAKNINSWYNRGLWKSPLV
jgi:hypothetical protein